MNMAELNQSEAAALREKDVTALLPLGAVEVHGDHLPLGTDLYLAEALTKKLEARMGRERILVLPALPYGQVWSLREAPGSIWISDEVLSQMLVQIGESLCRAGIRRMAVINTHVGNGGALKAAARILYDRCDMQVWTFTYPGAGQVIPRVCERPLPHAGYFHACEIETSYMLYLCPERVRMERAVCQYPEFPEEFDYTPIPWTDFMETAVLGDATAATKEKGEAILSYVVERMALILEAATE